MKRTALAVICFDKKLLFFQRDNTPNIPNPGKWQFPGGHIEENETPEEGVRRELTEEVSFVPEKLEYLGAIKTETQETRVYWSYVSKEESEKFKLGTGEGQAIKFMTIEGALKEDLTDNIKLYLNAFKKIITKHIENKTTPNASEFVFKTNGSLNKVILVNH